MAFRNRQRHESFSEGCTTRSTRDLGSQECEGAALPSLSRSYIHTANAQSLACVGFFTVSCDPPNISKRKTQQYVSRCKVRARQIIKCVCCDWPRCVSLASGWSACASLVVNDFNFSHSATPSLFCCAITFLSFTILSSNMSSASILRSLAPASKVHTGPSQPV